MTATIGDQAEIQRCHLGCLPEPLKLAYGGAVIYSWVRSDALSGEYRCQVDPGRFEVLVNNAPDDGACGYEHYNSVSYPTRDLALKAAERAGMPIAEWQYDGVETQRFGPGIAYPEYTGWTLGMSEVICPYCGFVPDIEASFDEDDDEECERCGREYEWVAEVEVRYSTYKKG